MSNPQQPAGAAGPTPAGIYDYLLGGENHSLADRDAAERALAIAPATRSEVLENRDFLQRAVRYVASQGVTQYIDLGSGYPTAGAVHEIAGETVPDPHVVYVDYDPLVAERSQEMLRSPHTITIVHDLRHPWEIIDDPQLAQVIDWSRPVAVLMVAILHFVRDSDNPTEIIATFRDHMVPGSFLVLSHGCAGDAPDQAEEARRAWDRATSAVTLRTPRQIEDMLVGFELAEPGLVSTTEWRTDRAAPSGHGVILAAVGRVP
jgi:S-adenosyl methyltransferase